MGSDIGRIRKAFSVSTATSPNNRPTMETYHESAYRCPRTDYTDRAADIGSHRERRTDVPCELLFRIERVLTDGLLGRVISISVGDAPLCSRDERALGFLCAQFLRVGSCCCRLHQETAGDRRCNPCHPKVRSRSPTATLAPCRRMDD
jgi:hypothetical protein